MTIGLPLETMESARFTSSNEKAVRELVLGASFCGGVGVGLCVGTEEEGRGRCGNVVAWRHG